MHLVEHLDGIAEMKMIRPVDDLEFGIGPESIAEWPNTGIEIDEYIVAGGEYEADHIFRQRQFPRIEGLPSDERLRRRREAA